jgi:hypothetical protein
MSGQVEFMVDKMALVQVSPSFTGFCQLIQKVFGGEVQSCA